MLIDVTTHVPDSGVGPWTEEIENIPARVRPLPE